MTGSTETYSDVYVLTIPGFYWFKGPAGTPRAGNKCGVGGNRQMISVGGLATITSDDAWSDWDDTDPWNEGIGVLDMSALAWSASFDAGAAAYQPPQIVQNWYNNGFAEYLDRLVKFC